MDETNQIEVNIWKGIIKVPQSLPKWLLIVLVAMMIGFWMFMAWRLTSLPMHGVWEEWMEMKVKHAVTAEGVGRGP